MNLSLAWVVDPKDNQPSVSLTNLVASIAFLFIMNVLQALGKVQDTGTAMEYFSVSSALYFGRRINFAGKNTSVDVQSNASSVQKES